MDDTEKYLSKAQESIQGAESELFAQRFNNVANRAYYAAFQAAIAALIKANIPVHRDKGSLISHQKGHSQFAGTLITRRKLYSVKLRNTLQNLLQERIIADYRSVDLSRPRAARTLQQAKDFVTMVINQLERGTV